MNGWMDSHDQTESDIEQGWVDSGVQDKELETPLEYIVYIIVISIHRDTNISM